MIPSAQELAMARSAGNSLQAGTVTISAETSVVNRSTLATTVTAVRHYPPAASSDSAGPARIRYISAAVAEVTGKSGQPRAVQSPVLSVPVADSGEIVVDDVVVWVTCPENPNLVGRRFRIKGMHQGSQTSVARFPLEEVS